MRTRFMRIIVFFDLPTTTPQHRKQYARFRKLLIKEGFIMMQESVYSKLVLNPSSMKLVLNKLKIENNWEGLVQVLTVTEKQYASIENITGNMNNNIFDSMHRLIIV